MSLENKLRFEILERDHFTCQFCGKQAPETQLEVDHLQSKAEGGSDKPDNLVAACRDCNRGKGGRSVLANPRLSGWADLVGKFFHELDEDGACERQGVIVGKTNDGCYVLQFFDWIIGRSTWGRRLVSAEEMRGPRWIFYDDMQEFNEHYDSGGLGHRTKAIQDRRREEEGGGPTAIGAVPLAEFLAKDFGSDA